MAGKPTYEDLQRKIADLEADIRRREGDASALKLDREKFSTIFRYSPYSIIISSLETGRYIEVNQSFLDATGYGRDEIIGRSAAQCHVWRRLEDRDRFVRILKEEGSVRNFEAVFQKKNGDTGVVLMSSEFIEIGGERCLLTMSLDVTRLKETEAALAESEEKYRSILQGMQEGYYELDLDGDFRFFNASMSRFLGCSGNELLGRNFREFMAEGKADAVFDIYHECFKTGAPVKNFECEYIRKDGTPCILEASAVLMTDADGRPAGFSGITRDNTEKKMLERRLFDTMQKVQNSRSATIMGLAKLAEYRDTDTGNHLERIREYSRLLAQKMAGYDEFRKYITPEYIDDLYHSSILHDIGKVGVPDAILLKPDPLTPEEFEVIKTHPVIGGDAIHAVETELKGQSFLTLGREIAYHHHEKWDGTGYPRGFKGRDIPLSARLVALADVYDALTSKRSYKKAFSHDEAARIIVRGKGGHFDPDVVRAFLGLEDLFQQIRAQLQEEED